MKVPVTIRPDLTQHLTIPPGEFRHYTVPVADIRSFFGLDHNVTLEVDVYIVFREVTEQEGA